MEAPARADALWYPLTVEEWRTLPPLSAYVAELVAGWRGSDGSTCSLDSIFGVTIGETTAEYRPEWPAWGHDFRYRVLRRLEPYTPWRWRRRLRAAADALYRDECLAAVDHLEGWRWGAARAVVWNRWAWLRVAGWRAARRRDGERYHADGPAVAQRYAAV